MEAVTIVPARASFWRRHLFDRLKQTPVVEPIDPVERREFHRVETATGLVTVLRISPLACKGFRFLGQRHGYPAPQHQQRG